MTTQTPTLKKPVPRPTAASERFWKAAKEHRLELPRCQECGTMHYYPRIICPKCWSDKLQYETVSGKGKVYTYTIIKQAANPAFAADVPYVYALIELDEGPRLVSNVIGCQPDDVTIGMPVEVIFEDVSEQIALPKFKPAISEAPTTRGASGSMI